MLVMMQVGYDYPFFYDILRTSASDANTKTICLNDMVIVKNLVNMCDSDLLKRKFNDLNEFMTGLYYNELKSLNLSYFFNPALPQMITKREWKKKVFLQLKKKWHRYYFSKVCNKSEFTLLIFISNNIITNMPQSLFKNCLFSKINQFLRRNNLKYLQCHFHPQMYNLILGIHPWYFAFETKSEDNNINIVPQFPVCVAKCGEFVSDQMIHLLTECKVTKSILTNIIKNKLPMPNNGWISQNEQNATLIDSLQSKFISVDIKSEIQQILDEDSIINDNNSDVIQIAKNVIDGIPISPNVCLNWLQFSQFLWELQFTLNINITVSSDQFDIKIVTFHRNYNHSKLSNVNNIINDYKNGINETRFGSAGNRNDKQREMIRKYFDNIISKIENDEIIAFTDGSSLKNPGPSGAGCVVKFGTSEFVVKDKFPISMGTNNIAELIAIWRVLRLIIVNYVKYCSFASKSIKIFTDSKYTCNVLKKRKRMKKNGLLIDWIRKELHEFQSCGFSILIIWIGGHCEISMNELADKLAKQAAMDATFTEMIDLNMRPNDVLHISDVVTEQ